MLVSLAIRDVVLIERLSLSFEPGLCVLTGETGAGKSILLDALGLALGGRGDSGLVRRGAEAATVIAEFQVGPRHAALALLREQDLEASETVVLRRVISADGRSRAFVNDQPVGVTLLRQLGETLVEVHSQFETHGLLDARTHRGLLDAHGGLEKDAARVAAAWQAWRAAEQARAEAAAEADRARGEEEWLRHAVAELEDLAPQQGEDAQLATRRTSLQHRERILEAVRAAEDEIGGGRGAERALANAMKALTRTAGQAGGKLDPVITSLDAAVVTLAEARRQLQATAADLNSDAEGNLETIEERLFALRAAGRKYQVEVDGLAGLAAQLSARLSLIEDQGGKLGTLARAAAIAREAYQAAAQALSRARSEAAEKLDRAVAKELKPLKLDRATFVTRVAALPEASWGPQGSDEVSFTISTNPGDPPGALAKIASGGELARFMLALKVVLAAADPVPCLVFDEVDTGIGGAVADAVGERLAKLAQKFQVMVVTHSPQVAARGAHHLNVRKRTVDGRAVTEVAVLTETQRREEIARMLSGAEVTDAAREAAQSLMRA